MKLKPFLSTFSFLALSFSLSCSSTVLKTSDNFEIIFTDVYNFWSMYDAVKLIESEPDRIQRIQKEYFDKGTKGLKLLIKKDGLSPKDYSDYLKDTVFYNSIRNTTLKTINDTTQIRNNLKSFEKLYPKAKFSDIYFLIGQFKHGGTVIDKTMIIELQKNSKTDTTKSSFLFRKDQLENLNNHSSLIDLIIHEQVHVSQKNTKTNSLLTKTINEGSADFIMYLQTKKYPSFIKNTYEYGIKNENILWLKFNEDLSKDYEKIEEDWFYNYHRDDMPPDLGYFMGFKICENYFNLSTDKEQAIEFMLNGKNSKKLLNSYKTNRDKNTKAQN